MRFEISQHSSGHDLHAVIAFDASQDDLCVHCIRSRRRGVIVVPPLECWQKVIEQGEHLLFSDRLEAQIFEEKNKIIEQNGWDKRVISACKQN